MVSCGPSKEELDAQEREAAKAAENAAVEPIVGDTASKKYCDNAHFTIGLYMVNGCEYIAFVPADRHQGEGVAVLHAGNCINPIHSHHEKILEEIHKRTVEGKTGGDSPY